MGETAQEVRSEPALFSAEERRAIVRSFIEQYLSGKIRIRYWEPGFKVVDIASGREQSGAGKVQLKKVFLDGLDAICSPFPAMNAETFQEAVDSIFKILVTLRSGNFVDGDFPVTSVADSRLSTLESRVTSIEKLFEELMNRLKIKDP